MKCQVEIELHGCATEIHTEESDNDQDKWLTRWGENLRGLTLGKPLHL